MKYIVGVALIMVVIFTVSFVQSDAYLYSQAVELGYAGAMLDAVEQSHSVCSEWGVSSTECKAASMVVRRLEWGLETANKRGHIWKARICKPKKRKKK